VKESLVTTHLANPHPASRHRDPDARPSWAVVRLHAHDRALFQRLRRRKTFSEREMVLVRDVLADLLLAVGAPL
jgi:hypothetical protein